MGRRLAGIEGRGDQGRPRQQAKRIEELSEAQPEAGRGSEAQSRHRPVGRDQPGRRPRADRRREHC